MTWQNQLIIWYQNNKRHLPFRETNDPYKIWVSEIMLQQTTVTAVVDYYKRFIERFPDVETLAEAELQEVYKYWEGLGYYRRAKNLHLSAKQIVTNGQFPDTYEDLLTLTGVGPYTAAAIMAFAYHQSYGAVDGNVLRVIARLKAIKSNIMDHATVKHITSIVNEDISGYDPSAFNQGLMDFANAICTPRNPKCDECPIRESCTAYQQHLENVLPIRIKKVKRTESSFITGIITYEDSLMLVQNSAGLLENLYGLIQFEVDSPYSFIEQFKEAYGVDLIIDCFLDDYKHVFTHKTWYMHAYHFIVNTPDHLPLYSREDIKKLPIPTAHLKIIKNHY